MPKLTKRSMGLGMGYASRYKREDLIAKLGAIEHRGEAIIQEFCGKCPRREGADPYELEDICAACSMRELAELMD